MTTNPLWTRRAVARAVCCLAVVGGASMAHAQSGRPMKFLVPTSPGSSADIGARAIGDQMQRLLNRSIIVENKVGAGGSLAAAATASAEANGDTLGILGNSYLLFPVEFPQQKFDPVKDVVPVAMISRGANVLLVAGDSPYQKLDDLVQRARKEPGKVTYASAGIGSSTYHSAERLRIAAKLDMLHVPFKGSPESIHEVISGRMDFAFAPVSVATPFVQSGKLRAIAVSSSKRSALLPQTPTTVEAGVPGSNYDSWLVALAPAKTPVATQQALNKVFNAALETAEVKQRFSGLGVEPDAMSLEELQAFVAQEHKSAMEYAKSHPR